MSDTYREELARAVTGEQVDPRRLAWLRQQEEKDAAKKDALTQAQRDIEKAREKYLADGEAREAKARPDAEKAHAELVEARKAVVAAEAELEEAKAALESAVEARRLKFGTLWQIADDVWGRGGVPRDNDGNPTVDLCAVDWTRVVLGETLVYVDRDSELLW